MPSQLLKNAINGDDASLVETSLLISTGDMLASDILYLKKKIESADKSNKYEKYLIACLYGFGAPNFEQDKSKAERLITRLVDDTGFSYAKMLLASLKEDDKAMVDIATKDLNPMAVVKYLKINTSEKPLSWGEIVTKEGNIEEDLKETKKIFNIVAIVNPILMKTSLKAAINEFIDSYINQLTSLTNEMKDINPFYKQLHQKTATSMFAQKPEQYIAKFWVELAKFFSNTNRRSQMCYAFSFASKINSKYEKQWLSVLGADQFDFNEIKNYIKFYITAEKIIEKKLDSNPLSDDELQKLYYSRSIELKNCELICSHHQGKMDIKQAREVGTLLDDCRTYHKTLESMIQKRGLISQEDLTASPRSPQ